MESVVLEANIEDVLCSALITGCAKHYLETVPLLLEIMTCQLDTG